MGGAVLVARTFRRLGDEVTQSDAWNYRQLGSQISMFQVAGEIG